VHIPSKRILSHKKISKMCATFCSDRARRMCTPLHNMQYTTRQRPELRQVRKYVSLDRERILSEKITLPVLRPNQHHHARTISSHLRSPLKISKKLPTRRAETEKCIVRQNDFGCFQFSRMLRQKRREEGEKGEWKETIFNFDDD